MPPRRPPCLPVLVLALTALALPAFAQTVYKCESGGHVRYQDTPCAGSTGKVLAIAPAPTASEVEAAQRRAAAAKASANAIPSSTSTTSRRMAPSNLLLQQPDTCDRMASRLQALQQQHASSLAGARHGLGVFPGSRADGSIGQMAAEIDALQARMKAKGCAGG